MSRESRPNSRTEFALFSNQFRSRFVICHRTPRGCNIPAAQVDKPGNRSAQENAMSQETGADEPGRPEPGADEQHQPEAGSAEPSQPVAPSASPQEAAETQQKQEKPVAGSPPSAPVPTVAGTQLARRIYRDRKIPAAEKKSLASQAIAATPSEDPRTYRIIIVSLASIAAAAIVFVFVPTLLGKDVQTTTTAATASTPATTVTTTSTAPELFLSLGSAAVGALAGLVTGQQLKPTAPTSGTTT
ncbi:MAG TPA: hypothetical protein VHX38_23160 [Pseudonocardiaceae bacterium]|nr:hypothetical protein [Pseudonocardiaceae bacterium]